MGNIFICQCGHAVEDHKVQLDAALDCNMCSCEAFEPQEYTDAKEVNFDR